MKKKEFIMPLALSALLVAGCAEEAITLPYEETILQSESSIIYSIDGQCASTREGIDRLLDRLFPLVIEGHTLTIALNPSTTTSAKAREVITFSTSDAREAQAWAKTMVFKGYSVTVNYNEQTQLYECVATK